MFYVIVFHFFDNNNRIFLFLVFVSKIEITFYHMMVVAITRQQQESRHEICKEGNIDTDGKQQPHKVCKCYK
jgi:hypothetical protein